MSDGQIQDVEDQLQYLWDNYTVTPKIMGMSLGNIRKHDWAKDSEIVKFLEKYKDEPDSSTVVLTPWEIRIYKEEGFQVFLDILKGGVT